MSDDALWGLKNCASCRTDLVRLRQGKIGAQVSYVYLIFYQYKSCKVQCCQSDYFIAAVHVTLQLYH